jgi:hypothetical protein
MGSDGIGRVSAADFRFTRSSPEFDSQHTEKMRLPWDSLFQYKIV